MSAADSETEHQQPALRVQDALGYLDQVKSKFNDQPFVYNQFLDIMKEFKSQSLDTPGVIEKVSTLFRGHIDLIVGFNTFLPPGYRIEQNPHSNEIRITTLQGPQQTQTTFTLAPTPDRPPAASSSEPDPTNQRPILVSSTISLAPSATTRVMESDQQPQQQIQQQQLQLQQQQQLQLKQQQLQIQPQQQQPQPIPPPQLQQQSQPQTQPQSITQPQQQPQVQPSPQPPPPPPQQPLPQSQPQSQSQTLPIQQPQPQTQPQQQPLHQNVQQPPAAMQPGSEFGFNHALNYVNKIKHRFSANPEVYQQFLEILHTYQRDQHATKIRRSKMLLESEVYNQVARLFQNQRDLLEEFSQFLPDANGTGGSAGSDINSLTRVHHQLSPGNVNSSNPSNLGLRHVNDGSIVMNDEITPIKRQNSRGANHQNKISMKRQNNSIGNLTYNSTKVSII